MAGVNILPNKSGILRGGGTGLKKAKTIKEKRKIKSSLKNFNTEIKLM